MTLVTAWLPIGHALWLPQIITLQTHAMSVTPGQCGMTAQSPLRAVSADPMPAGGNYRLQASN